MKVDLSPRARVELGEILEYYAAQQSGLDVEFLTEFEFSSRQLGQFPEIGSAAGGLMTSVRRSRRLIMRRFPYLLIYTLALDSVTIVAIAHQSRRPGSWRNRVEEAAPTYAVGLAA